MEVYQHIRNFDIRYLDVNFKDELKPSTVFSYMEDAACSSADELGFGYEYVKSKGYAFIVSSIICEFVRPVKLGEKVFVRTWPQVPSYVIFGREYQMCVEDEVVMNASSRWCLIDLTTNRLLPSKVIDNQDYSKYNPTKLFENVKWKIPTFAVAEGEMKFSLKIANSEYDHNMHVNNTRYTDYCFNCFSVEELAVWKLKKFAIIYVKQCHEGDVLRFYRKRTAEKTFLVQGVNENDEVVVQSEVTFV